MNTTDVTGRNIISADFTFTYDPSVLSPNPSDISVTRGPVILHSPDPPSSVITTNTSTPGTIIVSVFDPVFFAGSGAVVNINMRVIGQIGSTSPLTLNNFRYNNGLVCSFVSSGTLTVISGTLAGHVAYENAASPPVPVPYVTISAAGTPPLSTQTNLAGNYSLSGFGSGSYTVTPSKPDVDWMDSNGIFSDDPALIAQYVVNLITLNATQQRAACVSGCTSNPSSFDAGLIARWIVGYNDVGNLTGKWFFTPTSRNYPTVNQNLASENYDALLMGDVNGDWVAPTTALRPTLMPDLNMRAAIASLGDVVAGQGAVVEVPLMLKNLAGRGVTSYQFDVEYDAAVLEPVDVDVAGTRSAGMVAVANTPVAGLMKAVLFGPTPATGDGVYAKVRFRVIGAAGTSSLLTLGGFRLDDGSESVRTVHGTLKVANQPAVTGLVRTKDGRGIRNAQIVVTGDSLAEPVTATTDSFGYFNIDGLTPGHVYVVTVNAMRYTFAIPSRVVTLSEDTAAIDFVANE